MNNLLKLWSMPRNYYGDHWPEYYVFLDQHRDSDCLTRSNFRTGLAALGGESETVLVVRENHWAVGWVEWIAIHQDDDAARAKAEEMLARLESYPVLDEDDFSSLETEEADEVWRNCYSMAERIEYIRDNRNQFDFHDFEDLLQCCRGAYFCGYATDLIN